MARFVLLPLTLNFTAHMFRSYFRLVIRNLFRQKVYTLINLTGLSIGLSGAFILILYVVTELSYDRFHEGLQHIYRINTESLQHEFTYGKSSYVLGTTLSEDLPEEILVARTFNLYQSHIRIEDDLREEAGIFSADPELFSILTFDLSGGNIDAFDGAPGSAVISESMALRYFGEDYPVGKTLTLDNNGDEYELEIVAMFKDVPTSSSFRPDMIISNEIALQQMDKLITTSSATPFGADFFASSWSMYLFFNTYILIPEGHTPESVKAIMDSYEGSHFDKELAIEFHLQEYGDIYFGSGHILANRGGGSKKMIYIYSVVALLLLLTATLNYILLSISVLGKRKREMGLKMIHGAGKGLVVRQILVETTLFTLLGMILALTIAELILPAISHVLFGKLLTIDYMQNWPFTIFVLVLSVVIGVVSGTFLASKVLSGRPAELMSSLDRQGKGRVRFTKIVSTVQLALSMTLIICTGTIFLQLKYFTSADIGFDLEEVVSIDISDEQINRHYETLKERIATIPGVESVSGSMWAPPTLSNMRMKIKLSDNPENEINVEGLMVDYRIAGTLGLRMVEGRDFDPEMGSESGSLIINEEAVRALGIEGPVTGTQTNFGTIVGVVENFHIHSFHSEVPPMVIQFMPGGVKALLVRIQPAYMETVLTNIEALWEEILPEKAFHQTYLVDALAELYTQESRFVTILTIFSGLNLFISLLGIFGMSRLNTERRTREVGIRKVMGAESTNVLNRFVFEYILLTLLAALFAFPGGYLLMTKWLSNFEYHGKISIAVFAISGALSLMVVVATVAWHVWKAANSNPIDAIRYE